MKIKLIMHKNTKRRTFYHRHVFTSINMVVSGSSSKRLTSVEKTFANYNSLKAALIFRKENGTLKVKSRVPITHAQSGSDTIYDLAAALNRILKPTDEFKFLCHIEQTFGNLQTLFRIVSPRLDTLVRYICTPKYKVVALSYDDTYKFVTTNTKFEQFNGKITMIYRMDNKTFCAGDVPTKCTENLLSINTTIANVGVIEVSKEQFDMWKPWFKLVSTRCSMLMEFATDDVRVKKTNKTSSGVDLTKQLKFACGVEWETGLLKFTTTSRLFTAAHYDGSGAEVATVKIPNFTFEKFIQKYHSNINHIRKSAHMGPRDRNGTHIHFSFNRCGMPWEHVEQNLVALLRKHYLGMLFFDAFSQGTRRQTSFGFGILKYSPTTISLGDNLIKSIYTPSTGTSRTWLLRRIRTTTSRTHYEWRGTDHCLSAVFVGLKIVLLEALARKAVDLALQGNWEPPFDKRVLRILKRYRNHTPLYITSVVARREALKLLRDVRQYMDRECYRALLAWVRYVDILAPDVGSTQWFNKYEPVLIAAYGSEKFKAILNSKKYINFKSTEKSSVDLTHYYSQYTSVYKYCLICGQESSRRYKRHNTTQYICKKCKQYADIRQAQLLQPKLEKRSVA